MDWFYLLVSFGVCIFEVYIFYDFFHNFFEERSWYGKKRAFIIMFNTFILYGINSVHNSIVNIIFVPLMFIAMVLLFFEGKILSKLLYSMIAFMVFISCELGFGILINVSSAAQADKVFEDNYQMLVCMAIMKMLTFVILLWIKRIPRNREENMNAKNFALFMIVPVSTLFILLSVFYLDIDYHEMTIARQFLIIGCMLALLANVMAFTIFDRLIVKEGEVKRLELMYMRLNMENIHYEQIDKMNREHQEILHNIHHYFNAIGMLAKEKDDQEICNILSELQYEFDSVRSNAYCENHLLNAILCERARQAEQLNIQYMVCVEPGFQIGFVRDFDLIAMTGNLLDNAIEAASPCKEGRIKVHMFMENENRFSIIEVENNYKEKPKKINDIFITSKMDRHKHGIGIKTVKKMAEKYHGYLQINCDYEEFKARIILITRGSNL